MSIDVDSLKSQVDIVAVVGSYVSLKKRGAEFVGLCPFHQEKTPSFSVSPAKRFANCFGCGVHVDVIDFVAQMEGLTFVKACEHLGAKHGNGGWTPRTPIQQETTTQRPPRITSKPPAGTPPPSFAVRDLGGEPELIYPLKDVDGAVLGYECRYNVDGKKEVRMWTWGARGSDTPKWWLGAFSGDERYLYGLERLGERNSKGELKPIAIFEGPKKAEAGKRLLPAYSCISWTGGASAGHKHDWKPIKGRKVLLWPDADLQKANEVQARKLNIKVGDVLPYDVQPGQKAMLDLAMMLSDPNGMACDVKLVNVGTDMPDGWDIADAEADGWDTLKVVEWAKPRAIAYIHETLRQPPPPPPPPEDGGEEEEDEALPVEMSEDMLAAKFAAAYGATWRYVDLWGTWFEWRGDGWYKDETRKIDWLAVQWTRQAVQWQEAKALSESQRRSVNSRRVAGSVRDIALFNPIIAARADQWDTHPWLLGVPGGVVDLKTGELREPTPDNYITKRTLVSPEPGPAPLWLNYLTQVMDGNETMILYLQRFAGYCLTGETREQCFAFLYGTGQNGKGTFITAIQNILGDYAVAADADVFMDSDQNRHTTEMARLRGARLVAVDETDNSKRWNEKRIKRVTGGGKIEARLMRQDDFEFDPQFKIMFAGNHKPQLRGVGKAIQRRIKLVPFIVTIRDEEKDMMLAGKLEAEYPKILQWCIDGCMAWQARGLEDPPEVVEAVSSYIQSEDVIGEWLEERTEQRGETARPIAHKNYKAWMEERGEHALGSKRFWAELEDRGYSDRKSNGHHWIKGLTLRKTDDATRSSRYPDD